MQTKGLGKTIKTFLLLRLDSLTEKEEVEKIYLFTEMELRTAAEKIKAGKAVGQDVIPPEVVNITAQAHTLAVLDNINDLLAKECHS